MKYILLIALATVSVLMLLAMALPPPSPDELDLSVTQTYVSGTTYWGRNNYIEYIAGDLPIIISAPHGGYLKPKEIRNRRWGKKEIDYRSQENAREVADYIKQITGHQPHLIINHLHRIKLDANRAIEEAAQGDPWAEQAWFEFHTFIEAAKATVTTQCGQGGYFDLHTQGDAKEWVELGFGLTSSNLDHSDEALNSSTQKNRSTVKSLAYTEGVYFPEIIRGQTSLGGLLQAHGYKSTPSPTCPVPNEADYYNGGYNVFRHGSRNGGRIDGIQVETYYKFLHDDVRDDYSRALAQSIIDIYERYYQCPDPSPPLFLPLIFTTLTSQSSGVARAKLTIN